MSTRSIVPLRKTVTKTALLNEKQQPPAGSSAVSIASGAAGGATGGAVANAATASVSATTTAAVAAATNPETKKRFSLPEDLQADIAKFQSNNYTKTFFQRGKAGKTPSQESVPANNTSASAGPRINMEQRIMFFEVYQKQIALYLTERTNKIYQQIKARRVHVPTCKCLFIIDSFYCRARSYSNKVGTTTKGQLPKLALLLHPLCPPLPPITSCFSSTNLIAWQAGSVPASLARPKSATVSVLLPSL
jgi:hypothetical protein